MRRLLPFCFLCVLLALAACSGGGDSVSSTPSTTSVGGIATLSGLQAQLAAVVLQQAEVPDGLEAAAPAFSTNGDVAGPNQEALQKMVEQGRQLGVDIQFIPTDRLDPASPLRGGIQSSASVYTNTLGASDSFQETAVQARANNWEANYPELIDVHVTEVPQKIGDESIWLRIAGKDCEPSPSPGVTPKPCDGTQHRLFVDNVVFRVGRVRAYLQVSSLFDIDKATPDAYQNEVSEWAASVVQHAKTTFPTS